MIVPYVVMVEREPYSKTGLTSPLYIDYESYTMVPGVAASQDFLKLLMKREFRVEFDT